MHQSFAPHTFTHLTALFGALCWLMCASLSSLSAQLPEWDKYFEREVSRLENQSAAELAAVTPDNWPAVKAQWRGELLEMLGLAPVPEKNDLQVTITGSLHPPGLTIERLHYQSRPGLYVTANMYLPEGQPPGAGWPAVLYVCGHAHVEDAGRKLGNKTGYHHHGLWFARHGVACLMIDTVQLGELHGEHHGTYRLGRWDWISRGYTPAGVEAWNAIRAIDVLESYPEIDSNKIGITGRSGGGAYSWFAAALDDRIKVAVPVAGITDLRNHVVDDCVEGHCDCMYFINYFGWNYSRLAALVAPRPLLLANSDNDGIFPLAGVLRVHRDLSQLYNKLEASQNYGLLITPGPHKDTQELQVGAFRWLLRTLTDEDVVVDQAALKELEPEQLAVFQRELPADERVAAAGQWFVPEAETISDPQQAADLFQQQWLPELERTALALVVREQAESPQFEAISLGKTNDLQDPRTVTLHQASLPDGLTLDVLQIESSLLSSSVETRSAENSDDVSQTSNGPIVHVGKLDRVANDNASLFDFAHLPATIELLSHSPNVDHFFVRTRGANWQQADTNVAKKNHFIRRFYLLGQTPDQRQLADLLASLRWIKQLVQQQGEQSTAVTLTGHDRAAGIATLAGLLCAAQLNPELPAVAELRIGNYPSDPELAPVLPGVLRVCDSASLLAAARGSFPVNVDEDSRDNSTAPQLLVDSSSEPQQASGMKIVEVDQDSARVWVRATRWPLANLGDLPAVTFPPQVTSDNGTPSKARNKHAIGPILPETGADGLQYAVPGVAAEVRVGHNSGSGQWHYSEWVSVTASTDYTALVELNDLQPGASYALRTQVRGLGKSDASSTLSGKFTTLPAVDASVPFRLAIGTCQDFPDRDGPHGFDMYRAMSQRGTNAFVMAGDVVYYDQLARSVPLAHYHWQRTYSLPTLTDFHRHVPTFFLKDDHDTYVDDSWPGQRHPWTEDFAFEDGQRIFQQQTGLPSPAYRTLHIGADLQVWLMEGRDYRSANDAPDGPDKSIWGTAQTTWLEKTLAESTSKFKVVISPTPLVGPDRPNKADNHSNAAFATEGAAIRKLLASYPNTVSVCGDRHWQYHSLDPVTGLQEFSVGPASDRHAGGWDAKDFREGIHQFLRVAGGYLEIELVKSDDSPSLILRHLDTHGAEQHSTTLQ